MGLSDRSGIHSQGARATAYPRLAFRAPNFLTVLMLLITASSAPTLGVPTGASPKRLPVGPALGSVTAPATVLYGHCPCEGLPPGLGRERLGSRVLANSWPLGNVSRGQDINGSCRPGLSPPPQEWFSLKVLECLAGKGAESCCLLCKTQWRPVVTRVSLNQASFESQPLHELAT